MDDIEIRANLLLEKLAKNMNSKIVKWNRVDDAVANDISFVIIVDTSKYISPSEEEKFDQKSFIGSK